MNSCSEVTNNNESLKTGMVKYLLVKAVSLKAALNKVEKYSLSQFGAVYYKECKASIKPDTSFVYPYITINNKGGKDGNATTFMYDL